MAATLQPSARMAKKRPRRTSAPKRPKPPFPKQHQSKPGLESRLRPKPQSLAPTYRAAGKLEGRVALITGGDSGIGRAVAVLFAREGAAVSLVFLPQERKDAVETARIVEALGRRVLLLAGDIRSVAFCRRAVATTVKTLGGLDILINNAAYQQHQKSIGEISAVQLRRTFETNILAMFTLTAAALEHMAPGSAIINTGSITGLEGHPSLVDYASTKGAIHAFTKSLARSLVDRKIRVNCVAPGPVWTPLNPSDRSAAEIVQFGASTPMGRPAQPEEIAPAYVFFASDADSSYVTGEVLTLLGGATTAA
jgi:NAD(P)-dependent dehydrogenase (short-subunit alcohol dehydrogenase family)